MSQRKPSGPTATRRDLFRAVGLGLPALGALAACGKDDATDTTGGPTGNTGAPTATEARSPRPDAPWGGAVAVDPGAFPLGAQTGEPLPDGFVAWTYAPDDDAVDVHVARWDGAAWVEHDVVAATPNEEGYVHLDLDGLDADTAYAIQAVSASGAGSAIAHVQTAPDPNARVEVVFGGISCMDQNHGEFPALDELQTLGPLDAMLWLGDTVYADGRRTEDAYRALWQEQLAKATMQGIFGVAGSIWTWDDHEVDNNWNPQDIPPSRFQMAQKTFFETIPVPEGVRSTGQLWRSLRFGATVELFVLDVRSERDEAQGHYVSPEQLDWLKAGLSDSPCVWKVVVTSVPITDWPLAWDVANAQLDRWDGFPGDQRQQLLDHIVDGGLSGVLFVAGDLHQTTLSYVDPEGGKADRLLEFLVGPGGSFVNIAARILDLDQVPYADADWSAGRMVFRPDGTARLQTVWEGGGRMMEAEIDVEGSVTLELERHPWTEGD